METLYQFQILTENKLKDNLVQNDLVALVGEKACGKSILVKTLSVDFAGCKIIKFVGNPYNRYTDYGCFPPDILNKCNSSSLKKEYVKGFAKDIVSTLSNIAFISLENILDTLLSKDDKEEMEEYLYYFSKLISKEKYLFIFDDIDYFDNKSILFLYKILGLVINCNITNLKVVVVLDTTINGKQYIIASEYLKRFNLVSIEPPTEADLEGIVDPAINTIARQVPIKYLLELREHCDNINSYYDNRLEQLSKDSKYIKRILYAMSLLDEEISDSELVIFLSDLTNYEIFQGLKSLEDNFFLDKFEINQTFYYKIPELIKQNIRKLIPEYIALHRYELFVRQLEKETPFNYPLKYKLYVKMRNYENSYANAILTYCAAARGDLYCSSEELSSIDTCLNSSAYKSFFVTLKESYRLYNENNYNECFVLINTFFKEQHIYENQRLYFTIYLPEFVLELVFLKEMCTGRIYNYSIQVVKDEIQLAEQAITYANNLVNKELELRIREEKLLLQSYISNQSKKQQLDLYHEYFLICESYKNYMRKCNITTLAKWEIRYASLLLKINIISGVPDKQSILQEGYFIIERNKSTIPVKYIKAACNYVGDLMWRNNFDAGYQILDEVTQFITDRAEIQKWGVVFQMYIFTRLYKNYPDTPSNLIEEYNTIWLNDAIRLKMHEPLICNSNYSILLAATGKVQEAQQLLNNSLVNTSGNSLGNYNKYLLQTNLAAVEYLCGNIDRAILLESNCKSLIEQKSVPTFSYPFLQKRFGIMLDIYSNKKPMEDVLKPLAITQRLSTGYCSDNYTRPMLFSDINYWTD